MKRTITTKETTKEFDENGKVTKEITVEKTEAYDDYMPLYSMKINGMEPQECVGREITTGSPIPPSFGQVRCTNDSKSNIA